MRDFNGKQRGAILVGVVLTLFTWLFPPYLGECFARADEPTAFMGIHFLYDPPSRMDLSRVVWGQPVVTCRARIDRERANHQYLGIVIASFGLVFVLGGRPKKLASAESAKSPERVFER